MLEQFYVCEGVVYFFVVYHMHEKAFVMCKCFGSFSAEDYFEIYSKIV